MSDACKTHVRKTCHARRIYSNYGDGCFAVAGPKLWNSPPAGLRQADTSFQRFNRLRHFCSGAEIATHCDKLPKLHLVSFLTYNKLANTVFCAICQNKCANVQPKLHANTTLKHLIDLTDWNTHETKSCKCRQQAFSSTPLHAAHRKTFVKINICSSNG